MKKEASSFSTRPSLSTCGSLSSSRPTVSSSHPTVSSSHPTVSSSHPTVSSSGLTRGSIKLISQIFRNVSPCANKILSICHFNTRDPRIKSEDDKKRKTIRLLVITAGIVFLSASAATVAPEKKPVKIALEWFLNPHHAPFIIAQTNGYFANENLDVTFYPANGSQEGCRQALQGSVDFAITHEPQVLIMNAKGMLLETVAVIIPETLEVILSTISIDQLKGKTVAHGSSGAGSLTFAVMHQFLKSRGLTEDDVTIIMAKNCLVTGFITGTIDVVFNLYRTYQLHDIKKHMKRPFFVYELKDFGVPSFASMTLVCASAVPAEVRLKMARALQKAVDYIHANPDAAYECMRRHRAELDTPENKDVWPSVHPIFAKDVALMRSKSALKDFLADAGILKS